MNAPSILVTGATGKTGSAVVDALLDRGADVRAMVHRVDQRSNALAARGAAIVVADIFDVVDLQAALLGVERAYFVPPFHPHMMHSVVAFASAARRSGLEAVVGLSQWLANPRHPSLATRQSWLMDELFSMLPGAFHVSINPGFFADNYLGNGLISLAAQLGIYPVPLGSGRNAPPSTADIARVVAEVLMDPEPHDGRSFRPTGPRLLDSTDITTAISEAVGRPVRHLDIPLPMFLRALRVMGPRYGIDLSLMAEARWYYEEGMLGTWERGAPTSDVLDVTGLEAEEFAVTAATYATRPEARRTGHNLARAIWDMTRIGVTPAPRLDKLVDVQRQPRPLRPELSAFSDVWATEHEVNVNTQRDAVR